VKFPEEWDSSSNGEQPLFTVFTPKDATANACAALCVMGGKDALAHSSDQFTDMFKFGHLADVAGVTEGTLTATSGAIIVWHKALITANDAAKTRREVKAYTIRFADQKTNPHPPAANNSGLDDEADLDFTTSSPDTFAQYEPIFDSIAESFRFE